MDSRYGATAHAMQHKYNLYVILSFSIDDCALETIYSVHRVFFQLILYLAATEYKVKRFCFVLIAVSELRTNGLTVENGALSQFYQNLTFFPLDNKFSYINRP